MYRVITIEREYGCGAGEIAAQLASHLGWKLWDRELTAEIARVANVEPSSVSMCEERVDSTFQRLVKVFWRGSYERSANLEHQPFGPDRMVEVGEHVMKDIAERGNCVIVGRGAPYFLPFFKLCACWSLPQSTSFVIQDFSERFQVRTFLRETIRVMLRSSHNRWFGCALAADYKAS